MERRLDIGQLRHANTLLHVRSFLQLAGVHSAYVAEPVRKGPHQCDLSKFGHVKPTRFWLVSQQHLRVSSRPLLGTKPRRNRGNLDGLNLRSSGPFRSEIDVARWGFNLLLIHG